MALPTSRSSSNSQTQIQNPGVVHRIRREALPAFRRSPRLTGPGSAGLNLLQTYSVTMVTKFQR